MFQPVESFHYPEFGNSFKTRLNFNFRLKEVILEGKIF